MEAKKPVVFAIHSTNIGRTIERNFELYEKDILYFIYMFVVFHRCGWRFRSRGGKLVEDNEVR